MRFGFLAFLAFVTPASAEDVALKDIEINLEKGKCTRFPTPGADQHYVGTWAVGEDGFIKGVEKRILFANPKWKQTRDRNKKFGADCVVVWDITGHKSKPVTCAGCTFGVTFQASVNYEKSTCPKRIVNNGAYRKGQYDVSLKSDGTTGVYFSSSGKRFAEGYHLKGTFNYRSSHTCVWF